MIGAAFAEAGMEGAVHAREVGAGDGPPGAFGADETRRTRVTSRHRAGQAPVDAVLADAGADEALAGRARDQVRKMSIVDPERTTPSTPGEITALPDAIRTDRDEAGVVPHPDGRGHAVAVFTRSQSPDLRHPAVDAVIGRAGRLAVDHLRSTS
ncbi:hypothetical protein SAMN05216188_12876 [Lentzea xinjiangensis]|uniref:Beta-lactamase class A n=1 Tax=Lentzea xinjiangensis TaxID=402600 RepID=A0A1H9VW15_9PSEU|nr:hypothetical protein [Lentzea xinjiangensis]SES26000.1 hypothetical protein SAMN05216188_12876 [Lentzea xinjiangensis]